MAKYEMTVHAENAAFDKAQTSMLSQIGGWYDRISEGKPPLYHDMSICSDK